MAYTDWTKLFTTPRGQTPLKPQPSQNLFSQNPIYSTPTGAPIPQVQASQAPIVAPKTAPIVPTAPTQKGLFFEVDGKKLYSPTGVKYDAIPAEQAPGQAPTQPIQPPTPPTPPVLTGDDFSSYYNEISGKTAVEAAQKEREAAKATEQKAFEESQKSLSGLITDSQKLYDDLYKGADMTLFRKDAIDAYAKLKDIDARQAAESFKFKQQAQQQGTISWAAKAQLSIINESFNVERAGVAVTSAIAQNNLEQATTFADKAYTHGINVLDQKVKLVENILSRAKTLSDDEKAEYKDVLDRAKELMTSKKAEQKDATSTFITLSQAGVGGINPGMSVEEMTRIAGPEIVKIAKEKQSLETQKAQADINQSKAATAKAYADITGSQPSAKASEALSNLALVNDILKLGPQKITGVGQNPINFLGITNQEAINKFNQLKASLSLENRQKLKGQGAVSDFEGRMLDKASSALGRNLNNEAMARELNRIRGVFTTSAGLEASIRVTSPNGETIDSTANRALIDKLIAEGNEVDYR